MWKEYWVATLLLLPWSLFALHAVTHAAGTARPVRGLKTRLVPRYYDFKECNKSNSFVMKNVSLYMNDQGDEYVNLDFELTSTAQKLVRMTSIVHRSALDTGAQHEYVRTMQWSVPMCNFLWAKNMVWTPLILSIHPPFRCPVRKGQYTTQNATLDFNVLDKLFEGAGIEKYAWHIECNVESESGLYICYSGSFEMRRVKVNQH